VFDHLRIGMAQPFANLSFAGPAEKGLAAEKVAKTVDPAVLKSDVTLRRRKLGLERFDHVTNECI